MPQHGRILLDDVPVDTMSLRQLRARIALVPQDTPLLHTSIAANISLGSPNVGQDAIERVARAAQLHAVIESLPSGYQTLVGDRGLKLSGGERQRLFKVKSLSQASSASAGRLARQSIGLGYRDASHGGSSCPSVPWSSCSEPASNCWTSRAARSRWTRRSWGWMDQAPL